MKKLWGKEILLAMALVALSGCVTYPIAKNLQQQAQRVTLSQVRQDPGAYQGTVVIWGGRIIRTTNDVNNSAMYVLCLPLDSGGKPVLGAGSPGRFIASSKDFLDPEIYKNGRLVTVAGSVSGLESQPIQNSKYNYPVLNVRQIHLWPVEHRYYYYGPGGGYYYYYPYPGWDWGWWYPGWSVGWYYGGDWDWDRGYHYHGGDWDRGDSDGGYHYQGGGGGGSYHYQGGGGGGSYHYQGGGGGGGGSYHYQGGGGGNAGQSGHWHR